MFFICSHVPVIVRQCPIGENLALADPKDIADTAAFAVLFSGRKRVHDSDRSIGRDSD